MIGQIAVVGVHAGQLIIMRIDQQQIRDQELRRFIVQPPRRNVGFIIGQKQSIELEARSVAGIYAREAIEEGYPLTGLAEGLRHAGADVLAGSAHFDEILAQLRAGLGHKQFADLIDMAVDESEHSIDALFLGVIEFVPPRIDGAVFFDLVKKSAEAQRQTDAVIAGEVGVAVDAGGNIIFFLQRLQLVVGESLLIPALRPLLSRAV